MTDDILIRWHQAYPETNKYGSGYDGDVAIGIVSQCDSVGKEHMWNWSMTATGRDADYPSHHGTEETKEGAKAATEACYRRLMAAHPGNRAHVRACQARDDFIADTYLRNTGIDIRGRRRSS